MSSKNGNKIGVALILGSTREGRFCDSIASWAAARIADEDDFELDVIDPLALDLPMRHQRDRHPAIDGLRQRLGAADAFVVVTPEYNHGYTAALKFLIDSVHAEWRAKPVAFVSYGGTSGGLRAVEQLRQVFAELHAVTVRDIVSFANPWETFSSTGQLIEAGRPTRAAAAMLAQLRWWAAALRNARDTAPYGEVAA